MDILQIKESILYCADLEQTRDFYSRIMKFPVITYVENQHVFFGAGRSVLLCFNPEASKVKVSPPPHFATGPQHIAFEVDLEEYEEWKKHIQDERIIIIDEIKWENGFLSFYFLDPDKHVLEIIQKGFWSPF